MIVNVTLVVLLGFWISASSPIVAQSNAVQQSAAQPLNLPNDEIIERVICAEHPEQSYAIYLPANYSRERGWPVLFAFDPGARGKLPVERYREAAEKYGWIIIGSNNSRNGPIQPSVDAWNAMVADARQRFKIDERRVYMAGFSGGARLAIYLAAECEGCVAGVIASGAGFPAGLKPKTPLPFPIFATVGVDDFNFAEVIEMDRDLAKADAKHQLEVFAGRHDWPPSNVAARAVEWMELQAIKSATRAVDREMIEAAWQRQLAEARSLISENKAFEAYRSFSSLVSTFTGLHDVTATQEELRKLQDIAAVKNGIRDEAKQIIRQREIEGRIRGLIATSQKNTLPTPSENDSATRADSLAQTSPPDLLKNQLSELRRQSTKSEDSSDRRIARRVLEGLLIGLFELGTSELQQKHYDAAVQSFSLATEVNPDRAGPHFYLASALAAKGDKNKSLRELKAAVERGFSDLNAVTGNTLFDSLRQEPQYLEILQTLKSRQ